MPPPFAGGEDGGLVLIHLEVESNDRIAGFRRRFFGYLESRRRVTAAALAAAFGALAVVHSTYAVFTLILLGAYAAVRLAEWRGTAFALACSAVPTLGVLLWIKPLVDETLSHNPSKSALASGLVPVNLGPGDNFRHVPIVFGR